MIFRGGYKKDWISNFYKFRIKDKNSIDITNTSEGTRFWEHKDNVKQIDKIIWDLPPIWDEIVNDNLTFQAIVLFDNKGKPTSLTKTVLHEDGYMVKTEEFEADENEVLYWSIPSFTSE